ncbi:MAG: MarC family protein [Chlamydiia bacterium]
MSSAIWSMAFTLFLLMDSPGNVPIFLSLLRNVPKARLKRVILRELLIAVFVILIFAFLGEWLFAALNIRQDAVLISGGVILFLIAIRMIFPPAERSTDLAIQGEPLVVPLAIPLVAGPSVLTAVMLYAPETSALDLTAAIFIAWLLTTLVLIYSSKLREWLGDRGLTATERLMGLILTMMAVQMFLSGAQLFLGHALAQHPCISS